MKCKDEFDLLWNEKNLLRVFVCGEKGMKVTVYEGNRVKNAWKESG
jgi:hypothetical protein